MDSLLKLKHILLAYDDLSSMVFIVKKGDFNLLEHNKLILIKTLQFYYIYRLLSNGMEPGVSSPHCCSDNMKNLF